MRQARKAALRVGQSDQPENSHLRRLGYFIYRKRKARFVPTSLWSDLGPLEWMLIKMEFGLHMQTDNWLVSRELSEMAGPLDARLWRDNDGEYFARVILASDGIWVVPSAQFY